MVRWFGHCGTLLSPLGMEGLALRVGPVGAVAAGMQEKQFQKENSLIALDRDMQEGRDRSVNDRI